MFRPKFSSMAARSAFLALALATSSHSFLLSASRLRPGTRGCIGARVANKPKQALSAVGEGGIFDQLRAGLTGQKAKKSSQGPTNEVISVVDGVRQKRLGNSGLVVSEIGLGTQRWASMDFNSPSREECFKMMDLAILEGGVNLIDTAEQYPIPSDPRQCPEGSTEALIGAWLAQGGAQKASRRDKVVLATKVTGGGRVTRRGIFDAVDGSLQRLGVDHLDLVQTHWPARYSPQSNWGQSLAYRRAGQRGRSFADAEEITAAFGELVASGKIRGYGFCNDNAVGLVSSAQVAKQLGVAGPCVMQNDFSLINRRIEENGVSEASAPWLYNSGFFGYNVLAGGVLTGKYLNDPPEWDRAPSPGDSFGKAPGSSILESPRMKGRFDDMSWGRTLYRYRSGPADEATRAYAQIAKDAGIDLFELSLRWALDREALTSVLLGSSSSTQLSQALAVCRKHHAEGPLPDDLLWAIDRVHMRNRLPIFSSYDVDPNARGRGGIGEPIP